ncbi:MAG: hypothetical protein RLZZ58_1742, partial [Pseudomonadota bacterium]
MKPRLLALIGAAAFTIVAAVAQTTTADPETLFKNVRVLDGSSQTLSTPTNVLIKGNIIAEIGPGAKSATATVV